MKIILAFFAWCVLLVLCWPLALLALIAAPLVWLLLLPVRIAVWCIHAALALVHGVLFLPARLLGYGR